MLTLLETCIRNTKVSSAKVKKDYLESSILFFLLVVYYTLGFVNPYNLNIHNISVSNTTYLKTYLIGVLGSFCYLFGYEIAKRRKTMNPQIPIIHQKNFINLKRLRILLTITTMLGLFFSLPAYAKLGLPILSEENLSIARKSLVWNLSPFIYYQWYFLELSVFLASIGYFVSRRFLNRIIFLSLILINLSLLLPVTSRVTISEALFYVIFARNYFKKKLTLKSFVYLSLFSLIIVSLLWYIRVYGYNFYSIEDLVYALFLGLFTFCRTSFEALAYFVEKDIKLLGTITFMTFIQLLPGKQHYVGLYLVSEILGKNSLVVGGTTVSLVGGLFIDFGIIGMIMGMFTLGYILKAIYERFQRCDSFLYMGIYAITLFYYIAMIYGGQFLDASLFWKLIVWMSLYYFLYQEKINLHRLAVVSLSFLGLSLGFYHLILFLS